MVAYKEENTMALKNLFLKGYSGVDEDDYSVSVYTQHAVYDSLFYLLDRVILTSGVMLFLVFFFFYFPFKERKKWSCGVLV